MAQKVYLGTKPVLSLLNHYDEAYAFDVDFCQYSYNPSRNNISSSNYPV